MTPIEILIVILLSLTILLVIFFLVFLYRLIVVIGKIERLVDTALRVRSFFFSLDELPGRILGHGIERIMAYFTRK